MAFDPAQYEKFAAPRLRPGLELLGRIPSGPMRRRVVDLGCGTGELTQRLAYQFPAAHTTGIDNAPAMLDQARARYPHLSFALGTIEGWDPPEPVDLVYANAALHWASDHAALLPRLLARLAPGGVLAMQVPDNGRAASHRLLRELATEPPWNTRVALPPSPVLALERYYDVLAPLASAIDLWETTYLHLLEGEDAVFEWVSGTTLTPVKAALDPGDYARFAAGYKARLRAAYPRRDDGVTPFAFRRLFAVAIASGGGDR